MFYNNILFAISKQLGRNCVLVRYVTLVIVNM